MENTQLIINGTFFFGAAIACLMWFWAGLYYGKIKEREKWQKDLREMKTSVDELEEKIMSPKDELGYYKE